jgi:hypothetical protein
VAAGAGRGIDVAPVSLLCVSGRAPMLPSAESSDVKNCNTN